MSDQGLAKLILDGDSTGLVRALEVAQRNMGNAAAASADLTKTVDSEMKAAEGAAKAVETASKATATMGTAAKAAAVPVRTLEQRIGRTKEGMAQLGAAVSVVSPQMGVLVMQASALTGAAKAAASGLNPVVLGVAALGAASIGAVSAVAAVAGSMVKLVSSADDMNRKLQPLRDAGFAIGAIGDEADRLDRSAASVDAVKTAFTGLGVTVATQVAPAVEQVATLVVAMTLAVNDTIKRIGVLDLVLGAFVEATLVGLVNGLTGVVGSFLSLADVAADTARAMGAGGLADALDAVAEKWNGVVAAASAPIKTGSAAALGAAYDEMAGNLGDYMEQARALIGAQDVANDKMKAGADAGKDAAAGMGEMSKQARLLAAALKDLDIEAPKPLEKWQRATVAAIKGLEQLTEPRGEGIGAIVLGSLDAIRGGLTGLVAALGGPIAGALAQFALNTKEILGGLSKELDTLGEKLKQAPAAIARFVEHVADTIIPRLLNALPEIVENMIRVFTSPKFLLALVKVGIQLNALIIAQIPVMIWAFTKGAIEAIPTIIERLGDALKTLFTRDFWRDVLAGFRQYVRDVFKEIVTLGKADTKTFGDTPGPVRVPSGGMAASFRAGDTVIAAQNPARLLAQAVQAFAAAVPSPAPAMAGGAPAPSYADTHRIFSAFEREHLRARIQPGSVTGRRY